MKNILNFRNKADYSDHPYLSINADSWLQETLYDLALMYEQGYVTTKYLKKCYIELLEDGKSYCGKDVSDSITVAFIYKFIHKLAHNMEQGQKENLVKFLNDTIFTNENCEKGIFKFSLQGLDLASYVKQYADGTHWAHKEDSKQYFQDVLNHIYNTLPGQETNPVFKFMNKEKYPLDNLYNGNNDSWLVETVQKFGNKYEASKNTSTPDLYRCYSDLVLDGAKHCGKNVEHVVSYAFINAFLHKLNKDMTTAQKEGLTQFLVEKVCTSENFSKGGLGAYVCSKNSILEDWYIKGNHWAGVSKDAQKYYKEIFDHVNYNIFMQAEKNVAITEILNTLAANELPNYYGKEAVLGKIVDGAYDIE